MKLKLNLDQDVIKEFFLNNVEKMIFAGVGVVCLWMIFSSFITPYENTPDGLMQVARNAENRIKDTPADIVADELPEAIYVEVSEQSQVAIGEDVYKMGLLNPPVFPPEGLRPAPAVFAVEELRGTAARGAFAMTAVRTVGNRATRGRGQQIQGQRYVVLTGVIPYRKQVNAFEEAFGECSHQDPVADVPKYLDCEVERAEVIDPNTSADQLQWQPIDVVKQRLITQFWAGKTEETADPRFLLQNETERNRLVFPLGPLQDSAWGPETSHPRLVGPTFEDVRTDPEAFRDQEVTWRGQGGRRDVANPRRVVYLLVADDTQPLGESVYFAVEFASEEIAAQNLAAQSLTGTVIGGDTVSISAMDADGEFIETQVSVPVLLFRSAGAAPAGAASAAGKAPATRVERTDDGQQYLLYRFFDYGVDPGKTYRYRTRLVLSNPNFNVEDRYLEKTLVERKNTILAAAGGAEQWKRLITDFSNPTDAITVPTDMWVLADAVAPPLRPWDGPKGVMMIVKWVKSNGKMAHKEFSISRGTTANFPGEVFPPETRGEDDEDDDLPRRRTPASQQVASFPVDYISNAISLDMRGGMKLPGRDRSLTEPGEVLVLAGDGSLVVQRELDDSPKIDHLKNVLAGRVDLHPQGPTGPTAPVDEPTPNRRDMTPDDYDEFDSTFN